MPEERAPDVPVPFATDTENPDVPEATEAAERKRLKREIAISTAIHVLIPLFLAVIIPFLLRMGWESGLRSGTGKEEPVEVDLLTSVPGGEDATVQGAEAAEGGAIAGNNGAPAPLETAPEPEAALPQKARPATLSVAPPPPPPPPPPVEDTLVEKTAPPPPPTKAKPSDELAKALAAAQAITHAREAPEQSDDKAPQDARDLRGRLLGALSPKSPGAPGAADGGAGIPSDGNGIGVPTAGGDGIPRKGFPQNAGAGGYGLGLEGEGDAAGDDDQSENERREWRKRVAGKVNKYSLKRPLARPVYPPGKPLYIHISFFPDGTLREVALRPPSSESPGPQELEFLRVTQSNIERAQPLPQPKTPKLYSKGLNLRSYILPGWMRR